MLRGKVLQYQTKALSVSTEGAWTIRLDDMIADALDLGSLRRTEPELPSELAERLKQILPEKMPSNVLPTLVAYYLANRPEDSDWVVLPVTNFDCYFGDTNFGRKYLNQLPREVIEWSKRFGISRYRVKADYLPNKRRDWPTGQSRILCIGAVDSVLLAELYTQRKVLL